MLTLVYQLAEKMTKPEERFSQEEVSVLLAPATATAAAPSSHAPRSLSSFSLVCLIMV